MLCCISCLPSPHTPIHKGGGFGARPTVVDSFMDACVGAGEAADAAKLHKYM